VPLKETIIYSGVAQAIFPFVLKTTSHESVFLIKEPKSLFELAF